MSCSAMSSERCVCLVVPLWLAGLALAQGRERIAPEEALRAAFPGCELERAPVHLDAGLRARVARRAGVPEAPGIAFRWIARRDGRYVGSAWFDTHRVRTLRETLLVAVGPDGKLLQVVVVAFGEPPDYLPRSRFYEQFRGRQLDGELDMGRGIDGVTGATLTSRATTLAARRVLALDAEVRAGDGSPAGPWAPALVEAAAVARPLAETTLNQRWSPATARPSSIVFDEARLQRWQEETAGTAREGIVTAFARGEAVRPAAYLDTSLDGDHPVAVLVVSGGAGGPAAEWEVLSLPGGKPASLAARERARRRCVALDRLLSTPAATSR